MCDELGHPPVVSSKSGAIASRGGRGSICKVFISDLPDGLLEEILSRTCWPCRGCVCTDGFWRLQPGLSDAESPLAALFGRHFGLPGGALPELAPTEETQPVSLPAVAVCKRWRQLLVLRPLIHTMALVSGRRATRIPPSVTTLFVCVPPTGRDTAGVDALITTLTRAPQLQTLSLSRSQSWTLPQCFYTPAQFRSIRTALACMTRLRHLHDNSGISVHQAELALQWRTLDNGEDVGTGKEDEPLQWLDSLPLPPLESFSAATASTVVCEYRDVRRLTALTELRVQRVPAPGLAGAFAVGTHARGLEAAGPGDRRMAPLPWNRICAWFWRLVPQATRLTRLELEPSPVHASRLQSTNFFSLLAPLVHLEYLSLANLDAMADPDLEHATALTRLTKLVCARIQAFPDTEALQFLQGLPSLRHLELGLTIFESNPHDAYLEPMSVLTALTHVALSSQRRGEGITLRGPEVAHIAAGSGRCLRTLALPRQSVISQDLAHHVARLEALESLTVPSAYVESGAVRGHGIHVLLASLTALYGLRSLTLGLEGTYTAGPMWQSSEDIALTIASLSALEELSLMNILGATVTVKLRDLPRLRSLTVSATSSRLALSAPLGLQDQLRDVFVAHRWPQALGSLVQDIVEDLKVSAELCTLVGLRSVCESSGREGRECPPRIAGGSTVSRPPASLTRLRLYEPLGAQSGAFLPSRGLRDLELCSMQCSGSFLSAALDALPALTRLRAAALEGARHFCGAMRSASSLRRLEIVAFEVRPMSEDFGVLAFASALTRLTALELQGHLGVSRCPHDGWTGTQPTFVVSVEAEAQALLASTAGLQVLRSVWLGHIKSKTDAVYEMLRVGMPVGVSFVHN